MRDLLLDVADWSSVNIRRVQALSGEGRMRPAGLQAFQNRTEDRSRLYSYEDAGRKLDEQSARKLRGHKKAWAFFQAQPPWYQRAASWWVMSGKKEATRLKRLDQLIADSAAGRTIQPLTRAKKSK